MIYDNGGTGNYDGISFSTSDNNLISSNYIYDSEGGTHYGINIPDSSDNNYIVGNEITGVWTAEIYDHASNNTQYTQPNRLTIDTSDIGEVAYIPFYMNASSSASYALFDIRQQSTGDIVNIFDGSTEVFTILDGGNVGLSTSTPYAKLSVAGDVVMESFYATSTTATSSINGNLLIQNNLQLGSGTYLLDSSTSTFSSGIDIDSGCFAIDGVCVGGGGSGSGTVVAGSAGQIAWYPT